MRLVCFGRGDIALVAIVINREEVRPMGARQKINAANFHGSFVVAGIAGLITESWTVFVLAASVLVFLAWHSGDIRTDSRRS